MDRKVPVSPIASTFVSKFADWELTILAMLTFADATKGDTWTLIGEPSGPMFDLTTAPSESEAYKTNVITLLEPDP